MCTQKIYIERLICLFTYISPTQNLLAAAAVDVVHSVQSSQEVAILIGAQGNVHPEIPQLMIKMGSLKPEDPPYKLS